ncbi:MAG: hypothetical protein COV99_03165 [Bacteroidetes bacterium CG12_big_fil_rev_8_21_14_0_65_60_17]|nr:MAG: hypothetical protein COV99_03165 [Bacteroidetes bacterium CG12_big_fil_rev_8_21_14_0_65_60_17]
MILKRFMMKVAGLPSCEQVNSFLALYMDDELAEEDRSAFERHLRRCKDCSAYFHQYRTTVELVQQEREYDIALPDELIEHTLEFLRSNATYAD